MCGIFGTVYREKPIDQNDLKRMQQILDRLAYRGPDGHGIWKDEHVLLGHRRLSIIDLSAAGAQPFEDPEHGLYMTYNGEIYNFQSVRDDLLRAGYQFKSHTDTEVIMLAYDCYGLDFLKHLHGMFALCLYDAKQNRLVLARDPIGEKPLFYYLDKDQFVFSSEIKAFHAYSSIPLVIDMQSLEGYFTLQYIPGEHTIYKNIQEIAPGKSLVIDLNNWLCKEITYWSLFDQFTRQQTTSDDELDGGLSKSITSRLVGDVKIGVLLSGGIDSSLIAWYIKNHGGNLMAFTAGFESDELDELPFAKQVADNLGMELVQINGGSLTDEIFEDVIFHADEPIGDAACIPTYLLAKELCQYVTVVLSGEGADELFLGYDHYRYEMWYQRYKWLLQWTRNFSGLSQ